jgi:serine/threonine protein kinase/Tol biopolymer transport system component
MGEVYRGRDTRLDRLVAIKILPAALAGDTGLRERFEREARAISSLSHPHICALFDVGRHDGTDYLVLELLEGETLAQRLTSGPIPPAQALTIAIQICDALDKAHRSGIVHRDLKPANVMLTKGGAKLLDFGLAKGSAPVVAGGGLSVLPTTPANLTAQGTILGTFQYMAPEQIEGYEADARTDIFAFGALLFEMLTGRPAFAGKTRASLLGAILKDEPPRASSVQPLAPKALDRIVATCLAKDPDDRYQSARDLLRDLRWIASGADDGSTTPAPAKSSRAPWLVAGALGAALLASTTIVVRHVRETSPPLSSVHFTIPPPPNTILAPVAGGGTGLAPQIAVSPDGQFVAFVGSGQGGYHLWVRSISALDARVLAGTEEAMFPFWSPDSRYIGFFANGKLKKLRVAGGPPVVICDAAGGRGGTWNRDNVIVFASSTLFLQRVSADGGVPQAASAPDKAYSETSHHRFPSFLPDGRHFVYTEVVGVCCPPPKPGRVRIGALDTLDATTLLEVDSSSAFASGHLLFNRAGTLMAQGFDATSRRFTGDAFPVVEHIGSEGSRYASFSASDTGVLVTARGLTRPVTRLTWVDRAGRPLGTIGEPATYQSLALSSDERRVAVAFATGTPENLDIWILDVASGAPTRLTFDPGLDNAPLWSPDGSRIVFQASGEGFPALRQKRIDGTSDEPLLAASGGATFATDWSADGRYVTYARRGPGTAASLDLWVLPLFGDRKPFPVIQTPSEDTNGAISPDGRWFAYQSYEGGHYQVYVRAFPGIGGTFQVSKDGGSWPVWRRDGKELFFLSPESKMMAAAIDTSSQFQFGTPTPLFAIAVPGMTGTGGRHYDTTKDGRRFLVNVVQRQPETIPLTVLINWLAAVRK